MHIDLMNRIRVLFEEEINNKEYMELIDECREIIIEYKNNDRTQEDAYNTLLELYKLYNEQNMEERSDFVADILNLESGKFLKKDELG